MTYDKKSRRDLKPSGNKRFDFGAALAIGVSLGLIVGLLLNNTAIGMVTGMLLATLANVYHEKQQGKENANIALAISVGALLIVIGIWVLSAAGWP